MANLSQHKPFKSFNEHQSPFIFNPYRYATAGWDWEDDFTSNTGWIASGTDVTYDYSINNRADFVFRRDGSEDYGYKDVGSAIGGTYVDDTAWVLRFYWEQTSQTVSGGNQTFHGMVANATNTFTNGQDAIGFWHDTSNIVLTDSDNQSFEANGVVMVTNSATFAYWVELIRTSSTTSSGEFFSDAYVTSQYSQTNTPASTTVNLDDFGMKKRNLPLNTDQFTGWNTDFFFADGVTVAP